MLLHLSFRRLAPSPLVVELPTELDKALAWSEWFCAVIRRSLALHPDAPDAQHWHNWPYMVEQSRLAHRLSGDSRDLLDDYRFWRERDPELKSLAGGENPDS
jgi:hypothetical protein